MRRIFEKVKRVWLKRPVLCTAISLVVLIVLSSTIYLLQGEDNADTSQQYTVKTGPLRISVTESGTVAAAQKTVVKNEVEGNTTIVYIVDEGTKVKKGDLLMELDSSTLTNNQVDQEIQVLNAKASYIDAKENYSVTESQAQSDVDEAELTYEFAQQDLKKYVEGEYPNSLKEDESKITLAEATVAEDQETLDWSKKLYASQFISNSELEKDQLTYKKAKLDLDLANRARDLLANYTHKRELAQLESDVKQAKMALERAQGKAKADVVEAEASFKAQEAQYAQQQSKLKKIESQLEKTKIYAPVSGQVIYATSVSQGGGPMHFRRQEPLKLGGSVSERQELFYLSSDNEKLIIETSIPEASIDKVKVGDTALITADSVPGTIFSGKISYISQVVDAETYYQNNSVKVYDAKISLDETEKLSALRTDMACNVEMVMAQFEKATYVPIEAVMSVDGKPTVYMVEDDNLVPRTVSTGINNGSVIKIDDGLKAGEVVTLAPPLNAGALVENFGKQVKG